MSNAVCPVCGERDPYPQWFCLARPNAKPGEPCSYSLDGAERMKARFSEKALALSQAERGGAE